MQKRLNIPLIIVRIAIIILVLVGVVSQHFSLLFANYGAVSLLYFTTQSNLLLLVVSVILLGYDFKKVTAPKWVITLEFMAVSATTLTFVVFALLLGPFMESAAYFYSPSNLTLHNLAPILGITAFLMPNDENPVHPLFGLISGFYYLLFAYVVYFFRGNFGPYEFPYFFLDYKKNGWFTWGGGKIGVIYYFVFIAALLFLISYALSKLQTKYRDKKHVIIITTLLLVLSTIINVINIIIKLRG